MNRRGFGENHCQKIKVDYAKQERTLAFSHSTEESGQHIGDPHEMLSKCLWDMTGQPGPRILVHRVAEETLSL